MDAQLRLRVREEMRRLKRDMDLFMYGLPEPVKPREEPPMDLLPIYDRKFSVHPTMTVGQLIEKLKEYPLDLRVAAEWEGQLIEFNPTNFEHLKEPVPEIPWPLLVINVD